MAEADTIDRPVLTLPDAEAAHLREVYARADVILEYGSGGSTVVAAEMPGKRVFSVESDEEWAKMMRGWFAQNPPAKDTNVDVLWSDIGPTKEWGFPRNASGWRRYARYPLKVWGLPEFVQPDVVLVDGRFRTGCALAAALSTTRPITVLFDDYTPRKHYHRVEDLIGAPRRIIGRMAEFEVEPMVLKPEILLTIIEMMTRP
ncbi:MULTISPECIES: hypothetical protein [unclassified Roseovarius]|jgi:hypothetical protein|uniref:hypothetical protein n=1 Tax=unclassified Roseovarius TaxID=2614913 RepID=UPI00006857D6|nr:MULTISPECIES: hypothetical protein [unclassified Roseovarius]EAQ26949.1 hypothetical protein ROS217_20522 [Roseovarius sp. 217]KJS42109.1 MAG: hypothetical protein VR71_15695 [Roseovarius sp. BRH_c41]